MASAADLDRKTNKALKMPEDPPEGNPQAPADPQSGVQLELFPSALEDALSLHGQAPGFFSILVRPPGRPSFQRSYKVALLPRVIDALDTDRDSFLSQASFFRPNRRAVNLWHLPLCFTDLDYHNTRWGHVAPEVLSMAVRHFLDDEGLPPASIHVSSGRGLYLKWFLRPALPQAALPRWNAVQKEIVARLADYGADPLAKDCSRVLRLVQTVNTKVADPERRRVQVVHLEERCGEPLHYDFDRFADEVLPFTRQQIRELRAARMSAREERTAAKEANGSREAAAIRFTAKTLRAGRMADLRRLIARRGGIAKGMREQMLFVLVNEGMGSGIIHPKHAHLEARALAHEVNPNFREGSEWSQGDLSAVIARGKEQYASGLDTRMGLYRFKTATLIDWFAIQPNEMTDNETLIDTAEKYRRKNDARRTDAAEKRRERRAKALRLHAWGWSLRKIAAHLGCGHVTVANDLKSRF